MVFSINLPIGLSLYSKIFLLRGEGKAIPQLIHVVDLKSVVEFEGTGYRTWSCLQEFLE